MTGAGATTHHCRSVRFLRCWTTGPTVTRLGAWDAPVRSSACCPSRWPRPAQPSRSRRQWTLHPPPRRLPPGRRARCRTSTWPARTVSAPPRNRESKVWYTVAGGVLSDVYSPTIDNTNVEIAPVRRHRRQHLHRPAGPRHDVHGALPDAGGMACRGDDDREQRCAGGWSREYVTDPDRDAVVMRDPAGARPDRVGGGDPRPEGLRPVRRDRERQRWRRGRRNGGADNAVVDPATTALVARHLEHGDQRVEPRLRRPAVRRAARRPAVPAATSGYAGTESDGLAQLDADRMLTRRTSEAPDGNVVQTGAGRRRRRRPVHAGPRLRADRGVGDRGRRRRRARAPFARTAGRYVQTWRRYDAGCDRRRRSSRAVPRGAAPARSAYLLSANVLKASEDKTFPGADRRVARQPVGTGGQRGRRPGRQAGVLRVVPRDLRPRPVRGVHRAAGEW